MNPVGVHAQHVGARGFYGYRDRYDFGKIRVPTFLAKSHGSRIPREAPGGVKVTAVTPPGGVPGNGPKSAI